MNVMVLGPSQKENSRELALKRDQLIAAVARATVHPILGTVPKRDDPQVQAVLHALASAIAAKRAQEALDKAARRNAGAGPAEPINRGATERARQAEREGRAKDFSARKKEKSERDRELRASMRGSGSGGGGGKKGR